MVRKLEHYFYAADDIQQFHLPWTVLSLRLKTRLEACVTRILVFA